MVSGVVQWYTFSNMHKNIELVIIVIYEQNDVYEDFQLTPVFIAGYFVHGVFTASYFVHGGKSSQQLDKVNLHWSLWNIHSCPTFEHS